MSISLAQAAFTASIKDAENLLAFFDKLNVKPPPPELEVLKRAGLVMAMTAWETYVEDRLQEAVEQRLSGVSDSLVGAFMRARMSEELKRLHNPNSARTLQLFVDYTGVHLLPAWRWNNVEPKMACEKLDAYLKLRGEVVHRSRSVSKGPPSPDPVTRDSLQKAVNFLKELVKATDSAISSPAA